MSKTMPDKIAAAALVQRLAARVGIGVREGDLIARLSWEQLASFEERLNRLLREAEAAGELGPAPAVPEGLEAAMSKCPSTSAEQFREQGITAMTPDQEHLLHTLARAVLNLGWHITQLRQGDSAQEEIEGYLEEVETALKEAVPGRKEERG